MKSWRRGHALEVAVISVLHDHVENWVRPQLLSEVGVVQELLRVDFHFLPRVFRLQSALQLPVLVVRVFELFGGLLAVVLHVHEARVGWQKLSL